MNSLAQYLKFNILKNLSPSDFCPRLMHLFEEMNHILLRAMLSYSSTQTQSICIDLCCNIYETMAQFKSNPLCLGLFYATNEQLIEL